MFGNTGKIIFVDLSSGQVKIEELPEDYYRGYIGGSGLAAKYFWERGDFNADPLSPEAMLLFMNGPLAGLRLSGASRGSVAGRSPLTGHWGDSSSGGYFAPELRFAGYDGIVVTGKAKGPSLLLIEDKRIEIQSAASCWGRPTGEVTRELKERFGRNHRVLVIGRAGENLVRYGNILNEGHHATGRAGFGAVMGAKNLKAILVRGKERKLSQADPQAAEVLVKELNRKIGEAVATNVLHENGTAANLMGGVYAGDVPVKNWQSNFWEEAAEALTGSTLTERYLTGRRSCAFCSIACKRVVEVKEGPYALSEGPGPEYETIVSFSTLIGSLDLAATCTAGRLCNDLGLDTISAGATIAWAMEAWERGDLRAEDTGGIELNWGDLDTVIEILLPAIALRRGPLGDLLAEGSVRAARKIGGNALAYTAHSKGLEAPMHDPRGGGHGLALTYAMSPRGACHVADPMLFVEMGARYYPEIGLTYELAPLTDENKAEAAAISVQIGAIENSACFCQFADGEITIPEWVELFNCVAGYRWDIAAMMEAGRRVFYIKRLINYRFGLEAIDDSLSPRMLETAKDGEPAGIKINLDGMRERFYELLGLDPVKGIPKEAVLMGHKMENEARIVWRQD